MYNKANDGGGISIINNELSYDNNTNDNIILYNEAI